MKWAKSYLLFVVLIIFAVLLDDLPAQKFERFDPVGRFGKEFLKQNHFPKANGAKGDSLNVSLLGRWAYGPCFAIALVDSNLAYIGNGGYLVVLDISNLSEPVELQRILLAGVVHKIVIKGNYAFVVTEGGGLHIIDINDVANPTLASSCNTAGNARNVFVEGNYAYIADDWGGLRVIDISDVTNPTEVGSNDSVGHAFGVYVKNNYAFVSSWDDGLSIIDISDVANPTKVGAYNPGETAWGVFVEGNYAYVADGSGGLRVVDISDVANPVEVGFYDTEGYAFGVFVEGNYAYVADESGGLRVVDISDVANPVEVGFYDTEGEAYAIYLEDNYAFVANFNGLCIIDISDIANLSLIGTFNIVGGDAVGIFVNDNYAYIADSHEGLRIIDISDETNPIEVGFYHTAGFARDVYVSGNYAYVADGSDGLRIIDVSDKTSPTEVGSYDTEGRAYGVFVKGNYAYIAAGSDGLRIIDVSDKTSPTEVGSYDTEGWAGGVFVDGNYAYIADWYDGLRVIDVGNVSNPVEIGFYNTESNARNVYVKGSYAYIADRNDGLRIIDISNVSNPVEVGFYDTEGYAFNLFVENKYAYIADGFNGLRVIDISDVANPTEVGFYDTDDFSYGVYVKGNRIYAVDDWDGMYILKNNLVLDPVDVSIPTDNYGRAGDTLLVPVNVSDLTDMSVLSYQMTVEYDSTVAEAIGIETSGTLSETGSWTALANTNNSGEISIGGFGATALSGSGVLVYMKYVLGGDPGDSSSLSFSEMLFNSGNPSANTTNGAITIEMDTVAVEIPLNNEGRPGDTLLVPVNVSDLTDMSVLSYQMTVEFDETKVQALGIETNGTLSATGTWTVMANTSVPGEITIGGFGANALSGSGTLIYMKYVVVGEPDQVALLDFNQMLFNSGNPVANVRAGRIYILYPIPSVPVLISPTNGSVGNISPVELKWHKSENAFVDLLQVALDSNFTENIVDTALIYSDTTFTLNGLDNLTNYYWRVKAANYDGESEWSEVWTFRTLGEPTTVGAVYPENNAVNVPIELTFVWTKAEDQLKPVVIGGGVKGREGGINGSKTVGSYWFELTKDVNGSSLIVDSTLTDTTKSVIGLENLTDYWWRVRAKNEVGWGEFTAWYKFTTIVDTPSVVNLVTPSNNSVGNILPIVLKWNVSELAESYALEVSTEANFATTIVDTSGLTDTTFMLNNLDNLTNYYWRVKAVNVGGESEWSEVWTFRTLGEPTTVGAVYPENNAVNVPIELTFVWTKAEDQTKPVNAYWFELTVDTSSGEYIARDTAVADTFYAASGLEHLTDYYWRVKASNEAGWSEFSAWFKFTTIVQIPDAVELISPVDSLLYDTTMTEIEFSWTSSEFAEFYEMEISNNEDFSELFFSADSLTDTTLVYDELLSGSFYWRVRAKNVAGESDWTSNYVRVIIVGVEEENGELPTQYALQQNYPNPFNPTTVIKYSLPEMSSVKIAVYDILGKEVEKLVNKEQSAGNYRIEFDASSASGGLTSGVYIYRIEAVSKTSGKRFIETKKMMLLK